uniref:U42-Theraphotoxin-Sfo1a_1 n=1 Tax=Selenotholus foelschei TaxID=1905327 RepID=A0A482Z7Y2_9ARAC
MYIKSLIVFFLAMVAMAVASPPSYERHCGRKCDLNICSTTFCLPLTERECKGKIRQGAGYCSCCKNCIIPLPKGSPCNPNPGYGIPEPVPYCDEGLTCDCRTNGVFHVEAAHSFQ